VDARRKPYRKAVTREQHRVTLPTQSRLPFRAVLGVGIVPSVGPSLELLDAYAVRRRLTDADEDTCFSAAECRRR
jgi:hypothetical protein